MSQQLVVQDPDVRFDFRDAAFDQTYPATPNVILSTMCANAVVMGVRGARTIRVIAKGNLSTSLSVKSSGPDTLISAPLDYTNVSMPGFISVGSGSATINGQLFIDGKAVDTSNPMLLLVFVPQGTNVKIGMVLGKKVIVRNVNGGIEGRLAGVVNLETDFATSANIALSGSGSFACDCIEGSTISVQVSGVGKVNIKDDKSMISIVTVKVYPFIIVPFD
jgi:hypothetical protein